MILGNVSPALRPLAVWAAVTSAAVGAWVLASTSAVAVTSQRAWAGSFEELLVGVAAGSLIAATTWWWLVTTTVVVGVVVGRPPSGRGLTRRLVLVACGVAVVAGVSSPALAGGGSQGSGLAGLPLPDRAEAGASRTPTPHQDRVVVRSPHAQLPSLAATTRDRPITVRAGDSLWSIARAGLVPGASADEIDATWRALYAANRAEIGPDPDLIRPGQRLRAPTDTDR